MMFELLKAVNSRLCLKDRAGSASGIALVVSLSVLLAASLVVPEASARVKTVIDKYGLNGVVILTVGESEKCISKTGGAKMGAQVHAWRCRFASSHQKFVLKMMQKGWYQVRSNKGGMCLDVSGSAKKNNAPVVQWRCKTKKNANQLWKIIPGAGRKKFLLEARHSGKCLFLRNIDGKVSPFVQRSCKSKDSAQNFSVVR
jgi:hypothetical protein